MLFRSGHLFLSTPPSWVATKVRSHVAYHPDVSIHATLVGGDGQTYTIQRLTEKFLSTPPSWVATISHTSITAHTSVSIHATLVGGDTSLVSTPKACIEGFYPRHPRGWRLAGKTIKGQFLVFLSTPPSWVATSLLHNTYFKSACFYPRHPRGWRLSLICPIMLKATCFYPRHPRGWRQAA